MYLGVDASGWPGSYALDSEQESLGARDLRGFLGAAGVPKMVDSKANGPGLRVFFRLRVKKVIQQCPRKPRQVQSRIGLIISCIVHPDRGACFAVVLGGHPWPDLKRRMRRQAGEYEAEDRCAGKIWAPWQWLLLPSKASALCLPRSASRPGRMVGESLRACSCLFFPNS